MKRFDKKPAREFYELRKLRDPQILGNVRKEINEKLTDTSEASVNLDINTSKVKLMVISKENIKGVSLIINQMRI